MPLSSESSDPDLQPALARAFEAAWRELQLTSVGYLSPLQESSRAELARRIEAAAADGERDPLRLKLMALRTFRPGLPLG